MRIAVLALLLIGCVDGREEYVADPMVRIASMDCRVAGAQVVIDATFDVRLQPGQEFRVEHAAALGSSSKQTFMFFGCNEWTKMQQSGCTRADETQPETQPISLHMTDNVNGALPNDVRIDVAGFVETDELVVEASRQLTCSR